MRKVITVLSPPTNCIACKTVKAKLDNDGIEYVAAQITEHPDIMAEAKDAGMSAFPIVVVSDEDGNRLDLFAGPSQCSDKLKVLRKELAAAA